MLRKYAILPLLAGAGFFAGPAIGAPSSTVGCSKEYSQAEFRHYAGKVYQRPSISQAAARRMRLMITCQHSKRARRNVIRFKEKLAYKRAHPYPPISAADAAWLYRTRMCESGAHGLYRANIGNNFYGAYQFTLSSWHSVGGSGYPHLASEDEQDYRALLLRSTQGTGAWPNCG